MTWLMGKHPEDVRTTAEPMAAAVVATSGTKPLKVLEIQAGIKIMRAGTSVAPLPEGIIVIGDGEEVHPSPGRRFYVSVETFDPYHLILESSGSFERCRS